MGWFERALGEGWGGVGFGVGGGAELSGKWSLLAEVGSDLGGFVSDKVLNAPRDVVYGHAVLGAALGLVWWYWVGVKLILS